MTADPADEKAEILLNAREKGLRMALTELIPTMRREREATQSHSASLSPATASIGICAAGHAVTSRIVDAIIDNQESARPATKVDAAIADIL